jgi:Predicted xylanase/chitin deacetylase
MREPRIKDIMVLALRADLGSKMKTRPPLLALALILCSLSALASAEPYAPQPERREILASWERAGGKKPPELVAGIYERDWQGCDFENKIAITVDDCLPNHYMAEMLDILKARRIKAVFFIIGNYFLWPDGRPMPRAKELLDRVVSEGHIIGSHSYWHKRMDEGKYRDNPAALAAELDRNEGAIDKVLGYHYPILYFRPPNGAHSTPRYELDRVLASRGQYLANWTITSFDWCMRLKDGEADKLSPKAVISRTVKQAREDSGGVVLLHGFPDTAEILDQLLEALSKAHNARGPLEFSTLGELMRLKYSGSTPARAGQTGESPP